MARGRQGRGGRRRGGGRRGRGGNSVGQFLRPHTGRQASRIANTQAGAEYNPEIRNLRQQAKGSRARQRDIGAWYNQLAQDYAQAQQAGQSAYQSAQDAVSKQLAEASQRSQAEQSTLSKQDEEFAKLVGGPKDTSGARKIAEAGAAAERSRVALNAPMAAEGANYLAALGGYKTAARMQGIESRKEEARRREKLKSDLSATQREKGAARVAGKEKIREADRAYSMQQRQFRQQKREAAQSARAAEQQAALAAQEGAADRALSIAKLQQEVREGRISARQAQEKIAIDRREAKTKARSGGLSPSTRNTNRKERQSAAALVHTAVAQAGPPKNKAAAAELERIAVEQGGSPREVHRAVAKLAKGQAKRRKRRESAYKRKHGIPHPIRIPGSRITK